MSFGLNIAQPATSSNADALTFADRRKTIIDVGGGVNLGEIIKPYIEGSPENGGADIVIPSRLAVSANNSSLVNQYSNAFEKNGIIKYLPYAVVGGAVLSLVYYFLKMR